MTSAILTFLNKVLESNEGSRNRLMAYAGKSFQIRLPFLSLSASISAKGLFESAETYTATIDIPLTAASYLINKDKLAIFKQIRFSGDVVFGREILEILAALQFTGVIYNNSNPLTMLAVNKFISILTALKNQMQLLSSNASHSISEYLLYESEDLVTRYEMEGFCTGVDDLSARTERLNAQINFLLKQSL